MLLVANNCHSIISTVTVLLRGQRSSTSMHAASIKLLTMTVKQHLSVIVIYFYKGAFYVRSRVRCKMILECVNGFILYGAFLNQIMLCSYKRFKIMPYI